jgi:hypothetical protein
MSAGMQFCSTKAFRLVPALLAALTVWVAGSAAADDFSRVIGRYREALWREASGNSTNWSQVKNWMAALNRDGTWLDIDYQNRDPAFWEVSQHLDCRSVGAVCGAHGQRRVAHDK